jgi:acetyl-CoA carboxylase, biotin carboxylase subunit
MTGTAVRTGPASGPDSLLAKVIVWAPGRDLALDRMVRALAEFQISGRRVRSTTGFLAGVLADPEFRAARHATDIVTRLTGQEGG